MASATTRSLCRTGSGARLPSWTRPRRMSRRTGARRCTRCCLHCATISRANFPWAVEPLWYDLYDLAHRQLVEEGGRGAAAQADASVRRAAEAALVECDTGVGEEHRIGHGSVVVCPAAVVAVFPQHLERAGWGPVPRLTGRDRGRPIGD